MNRDAAHMLSTLEGLGIRWNDAIALRRISMTLRAWFELECGTGEGQVSRSVERECSHRRTVAPPKATHWTAQEMALRVC